MLASVDIRQLPIALLRHGEAWWIPPGRFYVTRAHAFIFHVFNGIYRGLVVLVPKNRWNRLGWTYSDCVGCV